jgi:hypothetical protein
MFNFYIPVQITFSFVLIGGLSVFTFVFFLKNPDKLEAWIALICKCFRCISKTAEEKYVKYKVQSSVNSFIVDTRKTIPSLSVEKVELTWVENNTTADEFISNNQLVVRMKRSRNDNRNIVNATLAFVSKSILVKAKRYIAKYQRNAIDMFTVTKILQKTKPDILGEFVDMYLYEAMDNDKVNDLYSKFEDIDTFGLYFPVFITEMTFLGEKVFSKSRKDDVIYTEVNSLVNCLQLYSNRKISEESQGDYNGNYCKFSIRILGKSFKIINHGKRVYLNNLMEASKTSETIYIIGDPIYRNFIDEVVGELLTKIDFLVYNRRKYSAKIRDREGNPKDVESYLVVLRSKNTPVFYKQ